MNKPTSFAEACLMMGTTPEKAISEEARKYLTPREVLTREIDYITCCINARIISLTIKTPVSLNSGHGFI